MDWFAPLGRLSAVTAWLFSLALLVSVTMAQTPPPTNGSATPSTEATPPSYVRLQQMPGDVTVGELSNGLTVIVQENHVAPVATVRCFVANTGSAYEGRWLGAGISHLVEHLVSGGTTSSRSEAEIERIIDTFGGATNAYTSTDQTVYYIDCPARHVEQAIALVADSMQHVVFEPAEYEREKKVVQQELADGEVDRRRVQYNLLSQTVYSTSNARHPVIGYLDVLRRITRDDCIAFYRERYVPNNQVFVVVGDVQTQKVLDQVAREWASTPRAAETLVVMPEEPRQVSPRGAVREMEGNTCDFALAWPTVELSDPDLYALDVAAYILSEGDSSRLVRRLKYDEQLVLAVAAASYTPHYTQGWFGVLATCRPETWAKAQEEILAEVDRLRDELVGPAELAKAKKQKAAELVFDQQTVQQAAASLGRGYLTADDPLFDQQYVEGIQQVTAEQIREVARKYFDPQQLNRVLIAPPGGVPQEAAARQADSESPVRLERLSNGVRVLVKRLPHLPLVNIQAFILGGSLVESPETAGRSELLAQMLTKGTGELSAQEIAEYFDSIGGQIAMSAGRNTIYGSATVLRDDFPRAAEIFASSFLQPTLAPEEFAKVRQLALGAIQRRSANPDQEIFELYYDHLPENSPYHIVPGGKEATVEKLSVADLRAYHERYFVPQNLIVTIFGDIDPEEALRIAQQRFGQQKPSPEFEPIGFDRPNAIAETEAVHKRIGKPTAMLMMGYPGPSILEAGDYAAMIVLDAITSGYSYPGGWLHSELRGEGLVYGVHAFQITGPAPGYFTVMAQTTPDKLGEVVARIQRNMERARSGNIPADEFETAREMVMALHAQENTTIASQARQAALDELYGLGYAYDQKFDERIEAVTLEDVVRVAKKYLSENHVLVTSSPGAAP